MRYSSVTDAPRSPSVAGDEDRVVAELRSLKSQKSLRPPRIAKAVGLLAQTKSTRVRNAAALALADLRAHGAEAELVQVLARPDTKGARGTLLYALARLGARVPPPILAQIVAEDSYEAREEALSLLARSREDFTREESARAEAVLDAAVATADTERLPAIKRARDVLKIKQKHGVRT